MRNGKLPALALTIVLTGLQLALPGESPAQGVRGELRATGSVFEYRTVIRESLPDSLVPGDGTTRVLPDGTVVTCVPGGDCYWYRAGEEKTSTRMTQDLRLVSWPGQRGISSRVHLRGRFGSDSFWPRTGKEFEALSAYVDFDRTNFRVRAGRQDHGGGLGFYYFDGGSLLWRKWKTLKLEAFVGRSLARTLLEDRTGSLLEDADDLSPDKASTLWGVEGKINLGRRLSGTVLYQRELRGDSEGLYSERAALDARWMGKPATVEVSTEFDVAQAQFNEARVRARRPLGDRLSLQAEVRHYRPFFELWTIWGAFSPVGFTEGHLAWYWDVSPRFAFHAGGAYRGYEETDAGADFLPVEDDGWRVYAGADWSGDRWMLSGVCNLHTGFGAFRSTVDASARRIFARDRYLGVFALGTQQFSEFRFGDGQTGGAGLEGGFGYGRLSVDGNVGLYRHMFDNRPGFDDYTQLRGRLGVSLKFGTEPVARVSGYGKGRRS